jgi:hypothetical protein
MAVEPLRSLPRDVNRFAARRRISSNSSIKTEITIKLANKTAPKL